MPSPSAILIVASYHPDIGCCCTLPFAIPRLQSSSEPISRESKLVKDGRVTIEKVVLKLRFVEEEVIAMKHGR